MKYKNLYPPSIVVCRTHLNVPPLVRFGVSADASHTHIHIHLYIYMYITCYVASKSRAPVILLTSSRARAQQHPPRPLHHSFAYRFCCTQTFTRSSCAPHTPPKRQLQSFDACFVCCCFPQLLARPSNKSFTIRVAWLVGWGAGMWWQRVVGIV